MSEYIVYREDKITKRVSYVTSFNVLQEALNYTDSMNREDPDAHYWTHAKKDEDY